MARQRAVTSRFIADIPITSGDPMEFMKALDYSYVIAAFPPFFRHRSRPFSNDATRHSRHVSSYTISGHRFTHHSISLLLYRIFLPASIEKNDSASDGLPQPRLLDPSGTYILQASVRVQDGSKVETMTKGVNELLGLKETLKGVVELEIGDRLALDTRVR